MDRQMKARPTFDTTLAGGEILPAYTQAVVKMFVTDRYGTTATLDFGAGLELAFEVDEIEIFDGHDWVQVWATDFEFDRD